MIFDSILNTFEDEKYRKFALDCINNAPKYWFNVPASSSGRFHPSYALGDGGLLRHTLAVCKIMNYRFNLKCNKNKFTPRERDLLRISAIVHDMWKSGTQEEFERSKWTKFDHPLIAANNILKMNGLPREDLQRIAMNVMSHMGEWNTDKRHPDTVLPEPKDECQIFLHECDYLASRKDIEILFDTEEAQPVSKEPEPLPDINTWRFPYGKYAGKTIPEIAEINPGYITWAQAKFESEPARSLLQNFKL